MVRSAYHAIVVVLRVLTRRACVRGADIVSNSFRGFVSFRSYIPAFIICRTLLTIGE